MAAVRHSAGALPRPARRRQRRPDGGLDAVRPPRADSVAGAPCHRLARSRSSRQPRLIAIALAVSEACNNVVAHAYRTSEGNGDGKTFGLAAERHGTTVIVTVSDDGDGMTPRSDSPGLGLGMPLIATLSDDVKISPAASGTGTVVAMRFFSGCS